MASIYGICYDESQSGRCGIECEGFLNKECFIPDEIIDIFKEDLLKARLGELRLVILRKQTKIPFDEDAIIKEIAREEYGYEL